MKNLVPFDSSMHHYTADLCAVWCFDDRFSGLLAEFTKDMEHVDLVKIAGGAKSLGEDASPERDFVVGQVKASIRLHGTKKVLLMMHRDCGAFGGSKSFEDADAELLHFKQQLDIARNFLYGEIPDVAIEAYFADVDGLYDLEE